MTGDEYCDELKRLAEARDRAVTQQELDALEREAEELERTYWSCDNPDTQEDQ